MNELPAPSTASPPALRATALGKRYHVLPRLRSLLRDGRHDHGAGSIAALDDVELEVASGGALAVIGANGAGKSTLLRILAGLSLPSSGTVEVHGRIGTLLDLGAGLVDEWTGELNARSALALQGLPAERLDALARFAEIGSFFAQPVRTYSSGMRLRLAYALAMGLAPDILIADEVVAVGDEAFQRRCALELQGFLERGGTLVLATHNLYLADKLCQRALWLERGRTRSLGPVREVTTAYRDAMHADVAAATSGEDADGPASSPAASRPAAEPGRARDRLRSSCALSVEGGSTSGGAPQAVVASGEPWRIRVSGAAPEDALRVRIRRADGTVVATVPRIGATLAFARCDLLPGRFVAELCEVGGPAAETVHARASFVVRGARRELGSVALEHEWL